MLLCRSGRVGCSIWQPQLRGASPPPDPGKLPGVASSRGGIRPGWHGKNWDIETGVRVFISGRLWRQLNVFSSTNCFTMEGGVLLCSSAPLKSSVDSASELFIWAHCFMLLSFNIVNARRPLAPLIVGRHRLYQRAAWQGQ